MRESAHPPPPVCFVPRCAEDFVGPARKAAHLLLRKARALRAHPDRPLKLLVSGRPGIGKTSLVNLIACTLVSHSAAIEDVSGTQVSIELVRSWIAQQGYGSLLGPWSVKIVNEFDRCSVSAQDLLLTYLDRMRPGDAFLATTNLELDNLTERLQTRFLPIRLQPPENAQIAAFLARRWGVDTRTTKRIADGANGNVRAALADFEVDPEFRASG